MSMIQAGMIGVIGAMLAIQLKGSTHDNTKISPARLARNACSSLPLCFNT